MRSKVEQNKNNSVCICAQLDVVMDDEQTIVKRQPTPVCCALVCHVDERYMEQITTEVMLYLLLTFLALHCLPAA